MLRKIALVLLAGWAILSVGLLAQFLYDSEALTASKEDRWLRSELEVRLTWEIMFLNLPLSFGVAAIAPSILPESVGGPITEWGILTLAGFVQWVILVPAIIRASLKWLKNRQASP